MTSYNLSRGLLTLGFATALLGAGLSGSALAAQGSELNNDKTVYAESRGPAAGPLAARATRGNPQGRAALDFLELSGATGNGGQPS